MTTTKTEITTTVTTTTRTTKPKETTTTTRCVFQRWKSCKQQGGSQPCRNQRQPAVKGEDDDHDDHGDGEDHHDDHGTGGDDDND